MKQIPDPIVNPSPFSSSRPQNVPKQRKPKEGEYRNVFGAILSAVGGAASSIVPTGGACFGDKTCQENRAAATQAQLTAAQAELEGTRNNVTIIIIVSVLVLVLAGIGAFIYLKKTS